MADERTRAQRLRAKALRDEATRVEQEESTPMRVTAGDLKRFALGVDDLVRSMASGATFGFADEMAAAAGAATGLGEQTPEAETYQERLAAERARDVAIPASTAIPGQIAGGVMTGVGAAPALTRTAATQAPTIAQLAGRGALAGAGGGALSGAGTAEGGLKERLAGAATGGALGAVTGGVMGPVAGGASALVRAIRNRWQSSGLSAAKRRALGKLAESLEAESITEDVAKARLRRLGEEGMLADIGTEAGPVQGLARAAGQAQGPGRNIAQRNLLGRTRRQTRRLNQAIRRIVSGDDAAKVSDDLMEDRAQTAGVMYDRAFQAQPQGGLQSETVTGLLDNPTVKGSIARWRRIDPRAEGTPDNSLEALDQAYKFIGGRAQALKRSGDNVQANSMNELRQQLREAITDEVPEYKAALNTFSSRSQLLDALDEGRQVFSREPSEITRYVKGLDAAEKEQFEVGLAHALSDRLSRVAEQGDATKRLFGNDRLRNQVRAAFGNRQDFRDFARTMIQEARMARTARIATPSAGSQTALRQLEGEDLGKSPLVSDIRQGVMFGAPSALLTRGVRMADDVMNRLSAGPEDVRAELARLLLTPGQQTGQKAIQDVFGRRALEAALGRRAATAGGIAGGQAVGRLGPPINYLVSE